MTYAPETGRDDRSNQKKTIENKSVIPHENVIRLAALRADQILKVLQLTDSINLHRESIFIPLTAAEKGAIDILPDGRLKITCPGGELFEAWISELHSRLKQMDLSSVRH